MAKPDTRPDYDVIVVGAGMMGSAAAKYICTMHRELKVGLIGPSEPERIEDATIHGAHYDEGRIYRSNDINPIWGTMSKRTAERFGDIEKMSGLRIHHEVGFLRVGLSGNTFITNFKANIEAGGGKYESLENSEEIKKKFPYMDFGSDVQALHLSKTSGYLNPRNLVKAQKMIAEKAGCVYVDDVVNSVVRNPSGYYDLTLEKKGRVTSQKVLLSTGGFTHCRDLLPPGIKPDMEQHPETVILVEVDEDDRRALSGMPCMVYKGGRWDLPDLNLVAYILPPIRYPDGKYYLKVGHGHNEPYLLKTPEEITRWYHQGSQPEIRDYLIDVTRTIFPYIKMDRYKFAYCVTTDTPKGFPYVDLVTPGLGVAIGGCGHAAKSSDEIGKMAASMIIKGSWNHDLSEDAFKFKALPAASGKDLKSQL